MMHHEQMPPVPPPPPMPPNDHMAFEAHQMRAGMDRMNLGQEQGPYIQRVSPPPSNRRYSFETGNTRSSAGATFYEGFTLSKKPPKKPTEKATWALCKRDPMPFSQEALKKQLPKDKETERNYKELKSFRKQQVSRLVRDRKAQELDPRVEWTLYGLAVDMSRTKTSNTSMRVYLKRRIRDGEDRTSPLANYTPPPEDTEIIDLTEEADDEEESISQYSYPMSADDPYAPPPHYGSPPRHGFEHPPQHFMPGHGAHPQFHEPHHQQHGHRQQQQQPPVHHPGQHPVDPRMQPMNGGEPFSPHHPNGFVEEFRPQSGDKKDKDDKKDPDTKKDKGGKKDKDRDHDVKVHQRKSKDKKSDRRDKHGYDSDSSRTSHSTSSSQSSYGGGGSRRRHTRRPKHHRDSHETYDNGRHDVMRVHRRRPSDQSISDRSRGYSSTDDYDYVRVDLMPERSTTRRISDRPYHYRRRDSSYARDLRRPDMARRHFSTGAGERPRRMEDDYAMRERYSTPRRNNYMDDIHEMDDREMRRRQEEEFRRNHAYREQRDLDRDLQDRRDRDFAGGMRDGPRDYGMGGGRRERDRDYDRPYGYWR